MLNRASRTILFLLFSWIIYNSCTLFALPFFTRGWRAIVDIFFGLTIYPVKFGYMLIRQAIDLLKYTDLAVIIVCMFLGAALCLFLWWRKQTLFTAWLLAFSATVAGPGLIYIMPTRFTPPPLQGLLGFLCMNIFYLLLVIINCCQKKFWPDFKPANRIRGFLKGLCLRT